MTPLRVGVIGCGRISHIYFQNCQRFQALDVRACASLDLAEAQASAARYGLVKACTPQEIFADPEIECVLNLTVPAAHFEVSRQALAAGKHVYGEKPLVTTRADGQALRSLAAQQGLYLGSAPDTFLGGRWQTVRRLLDAGRIGAPTGVFAFAGTHGTERHNPNPDFYYQPGGGPLMDLGPYYLSAMVALLGPIKRVAGMARRTFDQRMIENGPRYGQMMEVSVDTHSLSLLEFASGPIGHMTMSFDIWDSETPRFEIYGEEGTICIPDPDPVHGANIFGGEVWLRTRASARWSHQPRPTDRQDWEVVHNRHGYNQDSRGLGLLDMAYAIREGRPARASGDLAYHVFEVMDAIETAPRLGTFQDIDSSCARPAALPETFPAQDLNSDLRSAPPRRKRA